ncbi:MAG: GNAT family N-acetyltransferase [Devosiaceae bacterium]
MRPASGQMAFQFHPVTAADEPLLRQWLSTPSSQEWWGEPECEIKLIYDGQETGESDGYIAHGPDGPFAYIQSWPCEAQPDEATIAEPWIRDQAPGTLGVDITIGRPDLLGKGLGSAAVQAFCTMLFEQGANRIIIDPDAKNTRAIRAYEKAGFFRFDTFTNENGSTTLLMEKFPPKGHGLS